MITDTSGATCEQLAGAPFSYSMQATAENFALGEVTVSSKTKSILTEKEIERALHRHQIGDWGDVWLSQRDYNDRALATRGTVLSAYFSDSGKRFWVITDLARATTKMLLAGELDATSPSQ